MSCTECSVEAAKYKCPKCYAKYCSVACCKLHKAKECEPVKRTEESVKSVPEGSATNYQRWQRPEEESEDFVHPDKLAKLEHNEEVKALLRNPHLRTIMENLVNTSDPEGQMEAAMYEPIFVEFANKCLDVVEPEGNPDVCSDKQDCELLADILQS